MPDDLTEFEEAARDRGDIDLTPPYDTTKEEKPTVDRKKRRHDNADHLDMEDAQEQFEEALKADRRYRAWVFRGHIKWARHVAKKQGIPLEKIDLWQILS